jgi:hypothetical protein
MQVMLIDRADYRWVVLLDDAGARHHYVRQCPASQPVRPHLRILSHGLVRFTEDRGVPVLNGGCLPGRIVVERQGDYFHYLET